MRKCDRVKSTWNSLKPYSKNHSKDTLRPCRKNIERTVKWFYKLSSYERPLKNMIYNFFEFNSMYGLELVEGYLRYKITSQNVSSEAQVKNFFIL